MTKQPLRSSEIISLLGEGKSFRQIMERFPGITKRDIQATCKKAFFLLKAQESEEKERLDFYIDGAARGNPGPIGIGVLAKNSQGIILAEISEYKKWGTNNIAEYEAVLRALVEADFLKAKRLRVFCDSELVVRQLDGSYRVKDETLKKYFMAVKRREQNFEQVEYRFIPREQNKQADKLANRAINLKTRALQTRWSL